MKSFHLFKVSAYIFILSMAHAGAQAQSNIDVHRIEITFNKTSSIIFPSAIVSLDRGSSDVLVQKAKKVNNVLQLKASRKNFPETNLSVITTDGKLHVFTVNYKAHPSSLALEIDRPSASVLSASTEKTGTSVIFQEAVTQDEMDSCMKVIEERPKVHVNGSKKYSKVKIALEGIFIHNDVLYYRLHLYNSSNISYDVNSLRFYIEDKATVKRSASQQIELEPLRSFGNSERITGKSESVVVYALSKFTIPNAKKLVIELYERNGGRHLRLSVSNTKIDKARTINEL